MRWNAQFRYSKTRSTTRDTNGCLVTTAGSEFVAGSYCQVERNAPAKHIIGTDGQEFMYNYSIYMDVSYKSILDIGDEIEINFFDGSTDTLKIIGTDVSDKKVFVIWL